MSDILVLAYHAVSSDWPAALSVKPQRFHEQLALLAARGYRGATFHDAVHSPPFPRTVAVTFDDAYRSVLDVAFPILERVGFPGTVFVPTDFPDRAEAPMAWPGIDQWLGGPYEHELRCLSWPQLRSLGDAGWEVGAHTRSHPDLTQLDDSKLEKELRESRERCEQALQRICRSLAYPYGAHNERVVEAARRAGFTTACTVPDRLELGNYLTWPRVGVWHNDGLLSFRVKCSPLMRRVRSTPAAEPLLHLVRRARLGQRHSIAGPV